MAYIYKITNIINNKWYIGSRKGSFILDDYMGSGTALKSAIKKYGIENFKKEILLACEESDRWFFEENELKNTDAKNNNMSYNLVNTSSIGTSGKMMNELTKFKISKANTGKIKPQSFYDKKRKYNENYNFYNIEKGLVVCTPYELCEKYEICISSIKKVVNGKLRSYSGWVLFENKDKPYGKNCVIPDMVGKNNPNFDTNLYNFYHKDHGSVRCLRSELIKKYNLLYNKVSGLIKGNIKSHKGWSLLNNYTD